MPFPASKPIGRAEIPGAHARASRYSGRVRVKLLYFGVLRDWFGVSDETIELMDGATVGKLLDQLRPRAPEDDRLWRSLAVAVNREYSSLDGVLSDGDEVAVLPPVSGGCGARVYGCAERGLRLAREWMPRNVLSERTLC